MLVSETATAQSDGAVALAVRPLRNPVGRGWIRAVLFDLDGTLYAQRPLRTLMALELLILPLGGAQTARRTWQALAAYRRAQEELRGRGDEISETSQLEDAASRTNQAPAVIAQLVDEWMVRRPLKYLRLCRATGLLSLLDFLEARGIACGVLSDYPAKEKLTALGIGGRFDPVLCSTDPPIGALKPHPRGFLYARDRWQIDAREVLVVGDRPEVDALGAAAAGMPCVIVGRRRAIGGPGHLCVSSLKGLHRVLHDCSR